MDIFIFKGDIICEDCAKYIEDMIRKYAPENVGHNSTTKWPQGPFPNGGGEADCPQHCSECHMFLENPLTDEGYRYVRERLALLGSMGSKIRTQWRKFYDI